MGDAVQESIEVSAGQAVAMPGLVQEMNAAAD